MDYVHPSQMTAEQRRENTARLLDRFAAAHDKVAASGRHVQVQRDAAASARRVARRTREAQR